MLSPVTSREFDSEVLASASPVLVEFGAEWCPPCRLMPPVLEAAIAARQGRLRVRTVDVDREPALQARYGVLSVPTLMVFVGGRVAGSAVGYMPVDRLLRFVDHSVEQAA